MAARTNLDTLVTVFGGSGFLGRHIVRALARRDFRVRVAVRRPDLAGHLQPLGRVGQIHAVQANLRYPQSIEAAVRDAAVVVNLAGVLFERGRQSFAAVHVEGARDVARAVAATSARLIHVSALGADPEATSLYARSKAAGEAAIRTELADAIILRPSVVFGPEDDFFNRFGSLARISPVLPLIGGGDTQFQPVFVGDVAECVARAVERRAVPGTTYELGGPDVKSFKKLMEYVLQTVRRQRLLVPIPFGLARFKASFLQFLPKPPLTPDQVDLLRQDNVVSETAKAERRTLEALGVDPVPIAAVVPSYLWRFRKAGQFTSRPA